MTNQAFQPGQELSTTSICNSDCVFTAKVVKRTAKTVTIDIDGDETRCKIHNNDEGEFIYPHGRYSMAPIFRAQRGRYERYIKIYIIL